MQLGSELRKNHLLAALPATEQQRWLAQLANGASSEIAVVGNEGIVGVALFMGGQSTPSRALVRSGGAAWRLPAQAMKDTFEDSPAVRSLLLHYTLTLIAQMTQTAVCNRRHAVDQQLCRWLLLTLDRLQGNEIVTTQEQIAQMLGVRRESVTEAALALQKAGLIAYARGLILVLDRPGLEARACECYGVVRKEYHRLLPAHRGFGHRVQAGYESRPGSPRAPAADRAVRDAVPA
jgi:CRP-like cAMP-binding protein